MFTFVEIRPRARQWHVLVIEIFETAFGLLRMSPHHFSLSRQVKTIMFTLVEIRRPARQWDVLVTEMFETEFF